MAAPTLSPQNDSIKTVIKHICFYLPSFGDGGVERMVTNLAYGLADVGVKVDFLVETNSAPYLDSLNDRVNFITPATAEDTALPWLINYLNTAKPQILMSVKDAAGFTAIKARQASGANTKIIARTGTALKSRFKHRGINLIKRWLRTREMKKMYRQADGHIAVAEGTKKELQQLIQVANSSIIVVKNPVITPLLLQQQHEQIDHPWFAANDIPLIMGMGGFRRQKDFATLIKAFAKMRETRPCRLLILGKGRQQQRLEQLCKKLNIADDVSFPGFTDNPYPWLKRADLFVLSSLWEGSPNVLTEALALGTPVVSTDCQSGPREILQDGRYGELVPLSDVATMSQAMIRTLDTPLPTEQLREATQDYEVTISTQAYLRAFEFFLNR